MSKVNQTKVRTRLSPEDRRNQLLDTAKLIITSEGLQAFTMEGLARAADVSAPLVYNYFSGRPQLLEELLKREYSGFIEETTKLIQGARGFEDIVRISVTSNFDHHAPGNILPILLSQPEIAQVVKDTRRNDSRRNARYLVKAAAETYQLTQRQSQLVVSMSSGASIAAAELAATAGLNREDTIEAAVTYILSGIQSISGQR